MFDLAQLVNSLPFSDTENKRAGWYMAIGFVGLWALGKIWAILPLPSFLMKSGFSRLADGSGRGARVALSSQLRGDIVGDADATAAYQPGASCQAQLAAAHANAQRLAARSAAHTASEGMAGSALATRLQTDRLTKVAQGN